ncbi:M14 family metallopeptidase [Aestuariirhabdus sp. Z084]|uniref:succinylglutamate desuccinylase/aspartoacylase family protein n=1 Tax=Aestuariirhabdus haliotis TaxID=2918751 RepID=UPI00201B354C|nr:succinylglutamate desuccinylase/aspartoacylase family protein [Aestuariirhabdus haliotis]MCL6415825.1 M14 family metallopeptidase [Aestuariirhabdus haliotis]MCL6419873.1 M14 family metallopeptidase [Aestuariirhabdus haliotis]
MSKTIEHLPLLSPALGTERKLKVIRWQGEEGPTVYLQAALHADEWGGIHCLHYLEPLLDEAMARGEFQGTVIMVPVANPIGLGQHLNGYTIGRFDFDYSGNFNRNFPRLAPMAIPKLAPLLGSDSIENARLVRNCLRECLDDLSPQLEAELLKQRLLELSLQADIVLDLHCDSEATLHLYANRRHQQQAVELAAFIGAPVLLLEESTEGAPFDDANAAPWWQLQEQFPKHPINSGCFACTIEFRGRTDIETELAEADARGLYGFLQEKGVLAGTPDAPTPLTQGTPLDGLDAVKAPLAGLVEYCKAVGDYVEEGERVAWIINPYGEDHQNQRVPVYAKTCGLMFARRRDKMTRPGHTLAKIAGDHSLAFRQGGKLLEY